MIQNPGWNIGKTLITQQRQKKKSYRFNSS